VRHKIDRFCRSADEDDFALVRSVHVVPHFHADFFVGLRGPFAQVMHTAMDVGVHRLVVTHHRIDDGLWLLARCGVVEIHERFAVDQLAQERKMMAATRYAHNVLK
jgi:hypothetical protein